MQAFTVTLLVCLMAVVSCMSPPRRCNNGKRPKEVKCESIKFKDASCKVNGGPIDSVDLFKQESKSECSKRKKTWGVRGNTIWVKDGCRAIFHVCFKDVPAVCLKPVKQQSPCPRRAKPVEAFVYNKKAGKCKKVVGCFDFKDDNVFRKLKACENKCKI